jgi:hypothetical protein
LFLQIFNVFEGKEIDQRLHLHDRDISALTFFNPLKYLITAAIDGSSKYKLRIGNLSKIFYFVLSGVHGNDI